MRTTTRTSLRRAAAASLFAGVLALVPSLGGAARADDPTKTEERRTSTLAAAFAPLAASVAPSVVEVRSVAGDDLGYAVAIDDGKTLLTACSILTVPVGQSVQVRTSTGELSSATYAGGNEAYDVAVLLLPARLPRVAPLPFGSSSALEIGQWVVAVGTAARPLAVGVVSALDRRVEASAGEASAMDMFGLFNEHAGPQRSYARVIQHDGAIDGEKHGCPLVDADGKLVGLNVGSAYRGSTYAAPIDDVRGFLADLKAGKPGPAMPRTGFLGVAVGAISNAAVVRERGIVGTGVEIKEIQPGGAADKAGLKPGDVVLAVGGEKVRSLERFGLLIRARNAGETVVLHILRGKEELDASVVVGARPEGSE